MENNKLQELTAKLYNDGLEKGRSEAERLLAEAKEQAAKIVADAKAEAEAIAKAAEDRAEDIAKNAMTEITLAGRQALSKIKSEIVEAVIMKSTGSAVKNATMDATFIKDMLLAVANNWNAQTVDVSLVALLSEDKRNELDAVMQQSAAELLKAGVEVGYSNEVKNGFKLGEKNGGYYISFTDESFDALLKEYLREKVSNMLFK
jgi:V/A-type H+-transporting ATPase subunit E